MEQEQKLTRAMEILDLKKEADTLVPILEQIDKKLKENEELLCLSAPQLGYNIRVFALKFADEIRYFVNPLYVKRKNLIVNVESCSTLGEQKYLIPRFKNIEFIYTKTNGMVEQLIFNDLAAFQFQQMYDFLEGLTLEDYGVPIDDDFFELSKEEQDEIVSNYLKSCESLLQNLQEDINSDPTLREMQHTVDFMTSVAVGETKLSEKKMNREQRRLAQKQARRKAKQFK